MNDEDIISKKDLLELTNISYGQLYRWKRKGLIPEDWFIRKSTFTGQETFFPKAQVLARIEKIKNMKEDISLDELADVFSPTVDSVSLAADDLVKRNIVVSGILEQYREFTYSNEPLGFKDILALFILNKQIDSGKLNLDEGRSMIEVLIEGMIKFSGEPCELLLMRKLGVFSCLLISPPCRVYPDKGIRIIEKISISAAIEELKLKLI